MARRHTDDDSKDDLTRDAADVERNGAKKEGLIGHSHRVSRRTMLGLLSAAAATTGAGALSMPVAAADLGEYISPSGDVTIPAGEYPWSGGGLDVGSDAALVGGGSAGDVVWNLESGTMAGTVSGTLQNVVVRGENAQSKAGIDLVPGGTIDGFVWPEGGQQAEDRALYTPSGGERATLRNSAWAWMGNNGAYVDKPPMTIENCAAVNNNIAGIRVGHRDGTSSGKTTRISNCLIAVTADIQTDGTNSANARGIRLRHPGNFVIENCYFVYLDVSGASNLIEIEDEAAGSTVEIRDCVFYNDSGGALISDESGDLDMTVENCVALGSGSREASGASGISEGGSDVAIPTPAEITGYAAANEIEGIDDGVGPWESTSTPSTTTTQPSADHTLVLHASPDNADTHDVSFTVEGDASIAAEGEAGTDQVIDNGDGTVTATSVDLNPDALDSYRFSGSVVDYALPDSGTVDVSLDGVTTTFAELVGEDEQADAAADATDDESTESDVLEVIARQSGGLNYEFVVDGTVELHETTPQVTAGHGDQITENDDGTVTVTGFTGNDGYGDAYLVQGSVLSFSWSPEGYEFDVLVNGETVDPLAFGGGQTDGTADDGTSDSGTDDTADSEPPEELPHRLIVDGGSDVTTYTFTVSGSVARDEAASQATEDGTAWDRVEDIARNGKVISLVGSGTDAYRFSGVLTAVAVDGDARLTVEGDD